MEADSTEVALNQVQQRLATKSFLSQLDWTDSNK